MGWLFERTEDTPLKVLTRDYSDVTWVCTDGRRECGESAWFGFFRAKDGRTYWVVALVKIGGKEGYREVGYKIMDETVGPYRKPPGKFWSDPRVLVAFGGQASFAF